MTNAITLLLSSRKFFIGTLTVLSVAGVVLLRALDKLPADAMIPTLTSLTAVGLGVIGSIAWEDVAEKGRPSAPEPAPSDPTEEEP